MVLKLRIFQWKVKRNSSFVLGCYWKIVMVRSIARIFFLGGGGAKSLLLWHLLFFFWALFWIQDWRFCSSIRRVWPHFHRTWNWGFPVPIYLNLGHFFDIKSLKWLYLVSMAEGSPHLREEILNHKRLFNGYLEATPRYNEN